MTVYRAGTDVAGSGYSSSIFLAAHSDGGLVQLAVESVPKKGGPAGLLLRITINQPWVSPSTARVTADFLQNTLANSVAQTPWPQSKRTSTQATSRIQAADYFSGEAEQPVSGTLRGGAKLSATGAATIRPRGGLGKSLETGPSLIEEQGQEDVAIDSEQVSTTCSPRGVPTMITFYLLSQTLANLSMT